MYASVSSRGFDPCVKFVDDANATHSSLFEHTTTPVLCRLYVSLSFVKLRAIEYFLPMELNLLALAFLFKFRLHLHQVQPMRFLYQALRGEFVDFHWKKRELAEEQDSNSFSTSGTSEHTLHRTSSSDCMRSVRTLQYLARTKDGAWIYYGIYTLYITRQIIKSYSLNLHLKCTTQASISASTAYVYSWC